MVSPSLAPEPLPPASDRLDSWKEIAAYLKRDERTVRRWEKSEGLPVRRHNHARQASVYALKLELDAWWHNTHDRRQGAEAADPELAPAAASVATVEAPAAAAHLRRLWRAAALCLFAVITIVAAWKAWRPAAPASALARSTPLRVAVIPFRSATGNPAYEFLSVALARQLSNQLSFSHSLSQPFPDRALTYHPSPANPAGAAQELHAEYLVLGSYTVGKDGWTLAVALHDAQKPDPLWRRGFASSTDDVAQFAPRVAQELTAALRADGSAPAIPPTQLPVSAASAEAQMNFMRAIHAEVNRDLAGAARVLDSTIRTAPDFAPAVALRAFVAAGQLYVSGPSPDPARLDEAVALYRRAIALRSASPFMLSRGGLFFMEMGRLEDGVALLREAIRLNPKAAEAHYWLSQAYRYAGLLEESLREAELALQLDPYAQELSTLNTYLYLGRYDEFLKKMPATLTTARALFYRGLAYYAQGKFDLAEIEFASAAQLEPTLLHARLGRALAHGIQRHPEQGLQILREIDAAGHADGEIRYKLAQCFAALGEPRAAIANLRRGIDAQFTCHHCFQRDPLLAPLRSNPQFSDLMQLALVRQSALRARLLDGSDASAPTRPAQ